MNILVIGNGFDLAHELNTQYKDFLEVINLYENMPNINKNTQFDDYLKNIKGFKIEAKIKQYLVAYITNKEKKIDDETEKFIYARENNFWLLYFNKLLEDRKLNDRNNWIDFELEIRSVIVKINDVINKFGMEIVDNDIEQIEDLLIINSINTRLTGKIKNYKCVISMLRDDLTLLIRYLEIYLEKFCNDCVLEGRSNVVSPDIQNIIREGCDRLLSFNYTKTFELLYGTGYRIQYDYIHGKASLSNTPESNNMVLGIDEYLSENRKNKDTKFIEFKKFYQRIYKDTECRYGEWLCEIEDINTKYNEDIISLKDKLSKNDVSIYEKLEIQKNLNSLINNPPKHRVYIFGHSLDVTDKDVLKELIMAENVYTIIFYHNKEAKGKLIVNLVKIIGQEELIRKTGANDKTIYFRQQQAMKKIERYCFDQGCKII